MTFRGARVRPAEPRAVRPCGLAREIELRVDKKCLLLSFGVWVRL